MPRELCFENGELVVDGRGNRGQAVRFWNNEDKRYYWRIRLIDGPLRQAGRMWTAPMGWRGLVDYPGGTEPVRCCKCGTDFKSPIPLSPGEEFCLRCAREPIDRWCKDYAARLKAWQQLKAQDLARWRKKGA